MLYPTVPAGQLAAGPSEHRPWCHADYCYTHDGGRDVTHRSVPADLFTTDWWITLQLTATDDLGPAGEPGRVTLLFGVKSLVFPNNDTEIDLPVDSMRLLEQLVAAQRARAELDAGEATGRAA